MKSTAQPSPDTPTILVVFGVTGDLTTKKIIPSLWHLFQQQLLPRRFSVIGFARRHWSNEDLKVVVSTSVRDHSNEDIDADELSRFVALFSYHIGTFEDAAAFQHLAIAISATESSWGVCASRLFYMAVPPSLYEPIFKNLADVNLKAAPCDGAMSWCRVFIEKPFGIDLKSAQQVQSLLSSYFIEEQIYRIDHYLFKEIIQGIENFRFSNNLFENTWDNTTIERIDIRLHESIGVESRGNFYDAVGALRDVGQNHMLEMLATLLMEYPVGKDADVIRRNRAHIIRSLAPWTERALREDTFRAQYNGYLAIDKVCRDSTTETYFVLKTALSLSRWKGVPIVMEAGKRMREARKEIVVTLKHPKDCLLCEIGPHRPNQIVFRLEPNDEIVIHFWTKKPGFERVLEERVFSFFLYEKETKVQYVEEYAKVLYAAMRGEQTSFVSPDEIEAGWKFADPIVRAWNRNAVPLAQYDQGDVPIPTFFKHDPRALRTAKIMNAGEIGIVGLGNMGSAIARRLIEKRWNVAGFNRTSSATMALELAGLCGAYTLAELVQKLSAPRTIWLMVPYQAVDGIIHELLPLLSRGDTIIDGGNSPYKESIRRGKELAEKGVGFLDVGVSGGPEGARSGASLMVSGKKELYQKHEQLFRDLAVPDGFGYMGKSGAGHFVKMVHNGIEYGMMQAIGEGFEIMKKSPFSLDLHSVAEAYNRGSVIASRLIGWLTQAYQKFGDDLDTDECCSGKVSQSGEGQWTVEAARELGVPAAVISGALAFRTQSQHNPSYTGRVVSALRHQFGGHDAGNKK